MSITDDELDRKLAAVGARVAARSASTREQLAALHNGTESALEVAVLCRAAFGAKLAYLGPDAGFPRGRPYNFNLVGPTYLADKARRDATRHKRPVRSDRDRAAGPD